MAHQDIDDTARLILMEKPHIALKEFAQELVRVHKNLPLLGDTTIGLWKKYRGFDGRSFPTHDYETGEQIRRVKETK